MRNPVRLKRRIMVSFVTLLILCITVSPALALLGGKVKDFSADMVEMDPDGNILTTSKLYISGDAMRIDGLPGAGGNEGPTPNLSMLVLNKQDKMYLYNHDKKLVYVGPVEDKDIGTGYKALDNIESEKVLGKEKVSGYACVKKEVVTAFDATGQVFKHKLVVWESSKFDFPLKTMDEDGSMHVMRNIKEGSPSKKLFRPLAGYKTVGSMMAAMGLDFGSMMDRQARGTKKQKQENMDGDQMMAKMRQAMGDSMPPEQKEQMMQVMAQAMAQAQQTQEGPDAAKKIWQSIPRRPGDAIASELKTVNMLNVTMGSRSTLSAVFDFYKAKLVAKGWKDNGMYLQNGEGFLHLIKDNRRLSITSAENPGLKGNYQQFYMIRLQGPDI